MRSLFTATILKTAFVAGFTFLAGSQATAQFAKNSFRPGQALTAAFINPGNQQAKVNALVSRPGNSQDFITTGPNTWQLESNSTYTYDTQGRLTMRQYADPVTNQNMAREITVYDANGNETEHRAEQFNGTSWDVVFGYRQLYTYNAQNLETEVIIQRWGGQALHWENEMREETTYNAGNQITTITNSRWEPSTNSWEFIDRMQLNHTNGTATSLLIQEFDGAIWEDVMRAQNVVWQVLYEIPSSYETQYYDNGIWENAERYTAIYDVNGGYVGVYQEWDPFINTWQKAYRETETYDNNKNYTGWLEETWDFAINAWLYEGEEREVLTYNGIDITQRLFQDSWSSGSVLQDKRKEVYSNFQTFNISGVKEKAELAVNVYPKPTSGLLTIAFPEVSGGLTATLTDVTGKTCLHKTFKNSETTSLNIETLPKGIYLLQLQTEAGSTVKRIIKQ